MEKVCQKYQKVLNVWQVGSQVTMNNVYSFNQNNHKRFQRQVQKVTGKEISQSVIKTRLTFKKT